MPGGIIGHGRRRPAPEAHPRGRAVALDWGIFSQRFWGASIQPLHRAVSRGIALNMVQKWLGHAQLTTTAIYANAVGEEEQSIAARMW